MCWTLEQNKKVQNFVNLMFQFGLVLTINKATRMTNKTISTIYRTTISTDYKRLLCKNCSL